MIRPALARLAAAWKADAQGKGVLEAQREGRRAALTALLPRGEAMKVERRQRFDEKVLAPFLLLALSSIRLVWRERRPGPGSLVTRPALVLVPFAFLIGIVREGRNSGELAFGGLSAAFGHVAFMGEDRGFLEASVLQDGALWQSLFALLILAGTFRHRDLWLGRAQQ